MRTFALVLFFPRRYRIKRVKLTPRFLPRPSVLYLSNGRDVKPLERSRGVPHLILRGQEVVVDPQAVQGSCKWLCRVVRELALSLSPQGFETRRGTLTTNLERSIELRISRCGRGKETDVQLLPGLGQCHQMRFVHLPSDRSTSTNAVNDHGIPTLNAWTVEPSVSGQDGRKGTREEQRGRGGVCIPQ